MLVEVTTGADGSSILHQFEWGRKEPRTIKGFEPYFYVASDTPDDKIRRSAYGVKWNVEQGNWIALDGTPVKKVIVGHPRDVPRVRNGLKHYCADMPYIWRYILDLKEMPKEQRPTVLHTDIEVINDGRRFPHAELAEKPIACISSKMTGRDTGLLRTMGWHPNWPNRHRIKSKTNEIILFDNEHSLMEFWVEDFIRQNPEVITGWNLVGFDMTYILNRLDKLGIDSTKLSPLGEIVSHEKGDDEGKRTIKGRIAFDLDSAYLAFQARKFESNKLVHVAQRELGANLTKLIDAKDTETVWHENPRKLLKYNSEDVEWTVGIDSKLGLVDTFVEMSWVTGCPLKDCIYLGKALEFWITRKIPRVPFSIQEKKGDFEGGDIMVPHHGVHEWLCGIDIVSAYPNSVKTFNIGHNSWRPQKVDGGISFGHGLNFAQHAEEESILIPPINDLFYMKDDYGAKKKKVEYASPEWFMYDRRRYAYKRLLNTTFGLSGFAGRWYFLPVAGATTMACREIIKFARKSCEALGYPVVASHTDALYFRPGVETEGRTKEEITEECVEIGEAVCKAINADVDNLAASFGVADLERNSIEFGFEKVARRGAFKNKTYYALKMAWVDGKTFTDEQIARGDDLEIKGFGAIRSDNCKLSKELQNDVLTMILNGSSANEVRARIKRDVDRIRAGQFTVADIGIPSSIRRPIHTYPVKKQEHRAAEWSNENLGKEYGAKSKPYVVFTRGLTDVVALDPEDDIPKGVSYDIEKIIEKLVKNKVDDILEVAGFNGKQLKLQVS